MLEVYNPRDPSEIELFENMDSLQMNPSSIPISYLLPCVFADQQSTSETPNQTVYHYRSARTEESANALRKECLQIMPFLGSSRELDREVEGNEVQTAGFVDKAGDDIPGSNYVEILHRTATYQVQNVPPEKAPLATQVSRYHTLIREARVRANGAIGCMKKMTRMISRWGKMPHQSSSKKIFIPVSLHSATSIQREENKIGAEGKRIEPPLSVDGSRLHTTTSNKIDIWQLLQELATVRGDLQYTLINDYASCVEAQGGRYRLRGGDYVKPKWDDVWQRFRKRLQRPSRISVPDIENLRQNKMGPSVNERSPYGLPATPAHTQNPPNAFSGLWNREYSTPPNVPDEASLPRALWWFAGGQLGSGAKPRSVGDLRRIQCGINERKPHAKPVVDIETEPQASVGEGKRSGRGADGPQIRHRMANGSARPSLEGGNEIETRERKISGGGCVNADQISDQASSQSRVTSWAQSSREEVPAKALPDWTS